MCGGARYIDHQGKDWRIYFPNPKASLPVLRSDGQVEWVKWGRRREEPNSLAWVQGGWARSDSVAAGKWNRFNPEFVRLAVMSFMEKDAERVSHWIEIEPGQAIEGLIAHVGDQKRLYVVTEDTPLAYSWVHDRWPKLVISSLVRHA